jgi:hypothetical protein
LQDHVRISAKPNAVLTDGNVYLGCMNAILPSNA